MGKDSDLLEASRNGNVSVVEKILSQKAKRSGPLASLRRGPGANVQDSSGYSALHHAALNGHAEVVQLLIAHDASTNLVDSRGSSALHLAAWAGHKDIVRLLLQYPHRPANPNLQTSDRETPLHCAAQHGHKSVLALLLSHSADPNLKNCRGETPLDLAAQYGRLEAVEMLVRTHPELLEPLRCTRTGAPLPHSPLHLASRNGHKAVVEVLLSAGVHVNLLTPAGTALHEASLCGKSGVVRALLRHGADLAATDSAGRTPLDLLGQFPPHVTKGIVAVINNHRNSGGFDSDIDDTSPLPPIPLGSPYENVRGHSPTPRWHSECAPSGVSPERPTTCRDSACSSPGPPSPRPRTASTDAACTGVYVSMAPLHNGQTTTKVSPTPPKKPPRRNLSVSPTHLVPLSSSEESKGTPGAYEYLFLARSGVRSHGDLEMLTFGLGLKEFKDLAGQRVLRPGGSVDQYVPMGIPRLAPQVPPVAITAMYENTPIRAQNPRRKLKRNKDICYENQEIQGPVISEESYVSKAFITLKDAGTPLSPTHYQQPPTPEHPPPSALQAERSIHEKIRPLSQDYKRRSLFASQPQDSKDCETEIEPSSAPTAGPMCPSLGASSGSLSSSVSLSDRSVSTDNVEEFVGDAPFAGLFKGSTMTLDGRCPVPAERPKTLRKLKHVYENTPPLLNGDCDKEEVTRRSRTPTHADRNSEKTISVLSPFDEQEEWAKISEIMASFGTGLVRESVFVSELEKEFQYRLGIGSQPQTPSQVGNALTPLAIWLRNNNMGKYESVFETAGYDDVEFINGLVTDVELKIIGVEEEDIPTILQATTDLPPAKTPLPPHNNNGPGMSVGQWLESIHLSEYADTFQKHLYTDMERVGRVWEVELSAVLDISKVGHRKRILHSFSGNQSPPGPNMTDINSDLTQLKTNIRQLKEDITKLPEVTGTGTLRHSHKKNRPAPPPPTAWFPQPPGTVICSGTDLEIRAPSELLLGVPSALKTEWRHQPLSLVTGCVSYIANYLGSTLVKELRGTESTRKSIQKLKSSSDAHSNMHSQSHPPVKLSISHRGVQFIDTKSNDVICEHAIRNIHCACQDADDLAHFAYITKDTDNRTHYCHVFNVGSMDQATEIILTLGQAFEVAYQLALRGGPRESPSATQNGQLRAPIASVDHL